MRKVEAGAALPKAVNIVARSVGTTSRMFRSNHQGSAFFKEAGPVGMVLCPADSTIRTATRGRESTPQASLNTRKAMCSTTSACTKQADSSLYFHRDREQVDLSRGGGVVKQASNKSDSIRRWFHQQHLLSAKKEEANGG